MRPPPPARAEGTGVTDVRQHRSNHRRAEAGRARVGIGAAESDRTSGAAAEGKVSVAADHAEQLDVGAFGDERGSARAGDVPGDHQRPGPLVAKDRGRAADRPVPVRAVAVAEVDEIVGVLGGGSESDRAVRDGRRGAERARDAEVRNRRERGSADAAAAAEPGRSGVGTRIVAQPRAGGNGDIAVPGIERLSGGAGDGDRAAVCRSRPSDSRARCSPRSRRWYWPGL